MTAPKENKKSTICDQTKSETLQKIAGFMTNEMKGVGKKDSLELQVVEIEFNDKSVTIYKEKPPGHTNEPGKPPVYYDGIAKRPRISITTGRISPAYVYNLIENDDTEELENLLINRLDDLLKQVEPIQRRAGKKAVKIVVQYRSTKGPTTSVCRPENENESGYLWYEIPAPPPPPPEGQSEPPPPPPPNESDLKTDKKFKFKIKT